MEEGDAAQQSLVRDAIESGRIEGFDEINRVITDTGALQYTLEQARTEAASAKAAIADVEDSAYRQALMFLADYAVERSY